MSSFFASQSASLVELWRSMDEMPWHGFVVADSDEFIVLHKVSERLDLDGYCAFRREDLQSISNDFAKLDTLQRALAMKEQFPKRLPRLALDSTRKLLESAESMFDVIVIERELAEPDVVEIGALRMAAEDAYVMRRLSPNAEWENGDRTYRYRDVTRVEFGAAYEQTLLAIARGREAEGRQAEGEDSEA